MTFEQVNPESASELKQRARYQPLLIAVVVLILGVVFDRYIDISKTPWVTAGFCAIIVWLVCLVYRFNRFGSLAALAIIFCFGGLRHHQQWNDFPPDDISSRISDDGDNVCVQCVALSESRWVESQPHNPMDSFESAGYSRINVSIQRIRDGKSFVAASGKCRLNVSGDPIQVHAGDKLIVNGKCEHIAQATNPGQFDARRHLRGQRQLVTLSCDSEKSLEVIEEGKWYQPNRMLSHIRVRLNRTLHEHLNEHNASMGAAILLGYSEQIDRVRREKFMVTGTVHVLAISGLHVGILAGFFILIGRTGIINFRAMLVTTIVFVIFYAWLVEFRPPVTRAAILIVLFCVAKWFGREAFSINTLAAAGLVVFALNPCDVFNVGAQLSFAAVAVIVVGQRFLVRETPNDPLDVLIQRARPWPVRFLRWCWLLIWNSFLVSSLIWVGTAVLVAHNYHLVAPASLVCNPLLVIPMTLALLSGFLLIVADLLLPPLSPMLGWICNTSLSSMDGIIEIGKVIPLGAWWTSGPSTIAVIVFYLLLLVFVIYPPTRLPMRWTAMVFCAWLALVMWSGQTRDTPDRLRITSVDVGHGLCTIIEFPNGKTLLYDAGSAGMRERTGESICGVLWHHQITHIDAIVVSHADIDHFNAIPTIADKFRIGRLYVSQPFLESRSPAVTELLRVMREKQIAVEKIAAGNKLLIDNSCEVTVLHPGMKSSNDGDNSDSLVISVQFGNRNVLLPGDLEARGLAWLTGNFTKSHDIVFAPHHGSINSLPRKFTQWSNAKHVVISADRAKVPPVWDQLQRDGLAVWCTGKDGAIEITLSKSEARIIPYCD